jgi:hypothetical protein
MERKDCTHLGGGRSIEFCTAVPAQNSHVDIPLSVVAPMVIEVLRRDLLNCRETALIWDAAGESILRKETAWPEPPTDSH